VMLYEMFTGEVPFDAPQPLDVAMLHMTEPPPPPSQFRPDLNPKLEAMILKALAKEPKERYPSGASLADALDKALQTVPAKAPPPTDPVLLSIPERVALSLAKRPLPPLPSGVSDPVAPPAAPKLPLQPAQTDPKSDQSTPPPPAAALAVPAPASRRSIIFLGVGIGLVLSLVLILVAVLLGLFLWLRVGNEGAANPSIPVAAIPGPVEGAATPVVSAESSAIPTASPLAEASPTVESPTSPQAETAGLAQTPTPPPPSPTPSPLPEPRLIADSAGGFSNVQGIWEYLVYKSKENKFEWMNFEQRKYGQCWYGQDYIRICPDSGHPGNSADVVWRWTSQIDGRAQVLLWAHKIDLGGDGVTIRAYHNNQEVQGQQIDGRDAEGVAQKNWFEVEVKVGDTLQFVMHRNGNTQNDHTFFLVQIYQR